MLELRGLFPIIIIVCVAVILVTNWLQRPDWTVKAVPHPTVKAESAKSKEKVKDDADSIKLKKSGSSKNEVDNKSGSSNENNCSVANSFPEAIRRWCSWIDKYACDVGLDSNLVAAVMFQESSGNPDAYSKDGAVGLMQVMPRDGIAASFICTGGPCFSSRPSMDELFSPEFNISYGTRMLASLIQRAGTPRDGLKSYGPAGAGYYYADIVLAIYDRYR
jgi:soluble lytic murein transglycosylase-like protein